MKYFQLTVFPEGTFIQLDSKEKQLDFRSYFKRHKFMIETSFRAPDSKFLNFDLLEDSKVNKLPMLVIKR